MAIAKRRILFLTVIPSPYQRQLFAHMAESNAIDVRVLYYAIGAWDRQWMPPKLAPYETVMPGTKMRWLGESAYYNPRVLQQISDAGADIVVISDYSAPTAQIAMRGLGLRGKEWMFWGEMPGFSSRGHIGSFVRRRLQAPLAHATAIAAIGSKAVSAYEELFRGKPVFNIPYFCDLRPYQEARHRASAEADGAVSILFSGQLIERKGVDVLIQAFLRIAPLHEQVRLVLLGSGPERGRFEGMVPCALRDRVVFLGHREPHLVPDIFATSQVFCLPSRHDGWGVVINEAVGAGLPVVVSDAVGAGDDLVRNGVNGYVTRAGDVGELAEALGRIVGDAQLRARFAGASASMADRWGLSEGVARWLSATDNVLSRRSAA
jgi:glycosyltransferase involved in cell wall biosynthesis